MEHTRPVRRPLAWWWRHPLRPLLLGLGGGLIGGGIVITANDRTRGELTLRTAAIELALIAAVTVALTYLLYAVIRRRAG